jgi:hypothetical protein
MGCRKKFIADAVRIGIFCAHLSQNLTHLQETTSEFLGERPHTEKKMTEAEEN